MAGPPIVVLSNRGPVSFSPGEGGDLEPRRGAGGLVSGLGPALVGTDATWISAAMTDGDREVAASGVVDAAGHRVRLLALDPDAYRMAYDVVCNATLWFAYHELFDRSRRPRFDRRWREAWAAYRETNEAFAAAAVETAPEGAVVLVQDYHLALVGPQLAAERPDLRTAHFSHTPFPHPEQLSVLPDDVVAELLGGMAGHGSCGFHSPRWAEAFERSTHATLGAAPPTFVSPLATDRADLEATARGDACERALERLEGALGGRRLLARVDRIELSKNLLRGFWAFDDLLERHPEWRSEVTFGAFVYPSRQTLPEYLAYHQEVEEVVRRVNERWADGDWTPILLDGDDDYPTAIAALRRYDALLVNPIRDGLNLVASEGALVNERDGVVVLSPEAGIWDQLSGGALPAHPYDVAGTADALHDALSMPSAERRRRATDLRDAAGRRSPTDWLDDQVAAALGS